MKPSGPFANDYLSDIARAQIKYMMAAGDPQSLADADPSYALTMDYLRNVLSCKTTRTIALLEQIDLQLLHAELSAQRQLSCESEGASEYDSLVQVARDTYTSPRTKQTVMLMYLTDLPGTNCPVESSPLPLFCQLSPDLTHHSMSANYQSMHS
eukprot:6214822-Pleurochrysis_carterae.AAC.6